MSYEHHRTDGEDGPADGTVRAWPWLVELAVVLWVSLGATALRSLLAIANRLTAGVPLTEQTASIVVSQAPDRPWLDLAYQVVGIVLALGPVALVWYLLRRCGENFASIGFDGTAPRADLWRGATLALLVGSVGLGFYLLAYSAGLSVQIAAVTAQHFPWTVPVLLAGALQNAVLEEVVILGFFLHRCLQSGVRAPVAIGASALIRGTYHLYQGFGGFIGNAVMGLFFGWLFLRWRRTTPFVIAHFLLDAVAFVGYLYLRGRVSWLP